jgi:hypothetical protein
MIRLSVVLAVAFATASCASHAGPQPAWLKPAIKTAEKSQKGYPPLSQFPTYVPATKSEPEWRKGVAAMKAMGDEVLRDPRMANPDTTDRPTAEVTARRARADAAADQAHHRVDTDSEPGASAPATGSAPAPGTAPAAPAGQQP